MDFLRWTILILAYGVVNGISDKLEFEDDAVRVIANTSETSPTEEEVEIKHTIIVSTKLKNNGAVHSSKTGENGRVMLPRIKSKRPPDDSGEVPVVNGYLALESTQIKTPDTRNVYNDQRPTDYFVSYDINPDGFDVYPKNAADPRHWKPSTFYNNINYWAPGVDTIVSRNLPDYRRRQKPSLTGKTSDKDLKDYYCGKCKEYREREVRSTPRPGPYQWNYETTTKVKIDGKLAKLN